MNLYFLYNYSMRLETGIFDGRPADYLFMLLFSWALAVIVALGLRWPSATQLNCVCDTSYLS